MKHLKLYEDYEVDLVGRLINNFTLSNRATPFSKKIDPNSAAYNIIEFSENLGLSDEDIIHILDTKPKGIMYEGFRYFLIEVAINKKLSDMREEYDDEKYYIIHNTLKSSNINNVGNDTGYDYNIDGYSFKIEDSGDINKVIMYAIEKSIEWSPDDEYEED